MSATPIDHTKAPFIAWSCAHDYNQFAPAFQISCEKHLRDAQRQMEDIVGSPAIEGVILYDRLERGMAVASLLNREGRSLPQSCNGARCDSHFDEDALCRETNDLSFQARVHAGSRGMLVRLGNDESRRFILLDQREAAYLHPKGRKENPDLALAAFGLLAHELGHARDYADGRPGLASRDEIAAMAGSARSEAVHAITDMALAEYIATRAECKVQVVHHGACAEALTRRIGQMARRELTLPALDQTQFEGDALLQRQMDLSTAGYVIGTLAAYREARAPIRGENGEPSVLDTSQMLDRRLPRNSPLRNILDKTGPALERAARSPDQAARKGLVASLSSSIIEAQEVSREQSRPKVSETSFGDWFNEL